MKKIESYSDMEELVRDWGIPKIPELETYDLELIFQTESSFSSLELLKGLRSGTMSVKFCLINRLTQTPIFVMDFKELGGPQNKSQHFLGHHIKLTLLANLEPDLRRKGIATYYLQQLHLYTLKRGIPKISLCPNPNDEIFEGLPTKNALTTKELKRYYQTHLSKGVELHFFEPAN